MLPDDIKKKILAAPAILPNGSARLTGEAWENRRIELINILCREEYGNPPPAPESLTWEETERDDQFAAGKAIFRRVRLNAVFGGRRAFSFPVCVTIPADPAVGAVPADYADKSTLVNRTAKAVPFFIYANFSPDVPDKYLPIEEIIDNGFGVISFYYQDVVSDDADFGGGLSGALGIRDNRECGKISMWAWAFMRIMDYAETVTELDKTRCAAVGHSRLGKTALLAGALDARFSCVISNESGCCGAAFERLKNSGGERIGDILRVFPFWFKTAFKQYAGDAAAMPFDQHFLLAAIAPRKLYVASAKGDIWADPPSEFASAAAAGEVWAALGHKGLVCADYPPAVGIGYHDGEVAYHIRNGAHYHSREDWNQFMRYLSK